MINRFIKTMNIIKMIIRSLDNRTASAIKMSMNVVRVLVVMLLHNINAQQYPPQDPSAIANALQKPSGALAIKSFVMNCFPANELAAFVNFETDRVNRLRYGDLSIMVAALKPNSDFVIQFREALTDGEGNGPAVCNNST